MTSMKVSRNTLDRLRPHAVFRDSWDTALNNALDKLDEYKALGATAEEFRELGKVAIEKMKIVRDNDLELIARKREKT